MLENNQKIAFRGKESCYNVMVEALLALGHYEFSTLEDFVLFLWPRNFTEIK